MRRIVVSAMFCGAFALPACGLKGDLHLREPRPAPAAEQPAPVEAPTQKEEEGPESARPAPQPQ